MRQYKPVLSFHAKIVLLCVSVAVASSALHALISYRDISGLSHKRAIELLGNETRLNGERLLIPFQQMQQDAAILAGTPPVRAMFDILSGRAEAVEDNDLAIWRRRLEAIFKAQLSVRESYFQLRLIGIWDGGREIVRLDVTDGAIRATPEARLQAKGNESYMRPFFDPRPPRRDFFSDLSRNRESGVVAPGAPWTIRLVHPVAGADGEILGAIVINSDYDALVGRANLRVHPDGAVIADYDSGDRVSVLVGAGFGTDIARLAAKRGALAAGQAKAEPVEDLQVQRGGDWTRVSLSETLPALSGAHALRVSAAMPTAVLMASAQATLRRQILLSLLVLALTAGAASVFGVRLTRPLRRLTDKIARRTPGQTLDLDTSARDEIGRLARTFTRMTNDLILQTGQARSVFDHAVDGLLTADRSGTILSMNPAAYRMFGHAAGSLVGRPISTLMPEESHAPHARHMEALLDEETELPMADLREVDGQRADGERFPVEVKVSHVSSGEHSVYVAIIRDISEHRAAEEHQRRLFEELESSNARLTQSNAELAQAKTELERSNAELDKFAYVASHDLRAPLRVIDNASRWLEEDLAEFLDDDTRESMELLRGRVSRMERLLQDLLGHSRIGRISEGDATIDGPDLIANIRALTAIPDGFVFEVDAAFGGLHLPQFPIQTVLVNLVSNAVKHHDRADGRITLGMTEADDHYVFEVTDDGPGIAEEFHQKVFDMFQTLKPRDEVEGSGMGLAIVKKTVEVEGGAIELTSAPGEGSRFRVTWPRPDPAAGTGEEAA